MTEIDVPVSGPEHPRTRKSRENDWLQTTRFTSQSSDPGQKKREPKSSQTQSKHHLSLLYSTVYELGKLVGVPIRLHWIRPTVTGEMKLARRLVQNFEGSEDEDYKEDRPAPKDALGRVLALVKQIGVLASASVPQEDVLRDWRPRSPAVWVDSNSLGVYFHIPRPLNFTPHRC
ncbi:hypothetical protein K438DRAFT_1763918 [Mycena galopus ATCC 62051]|nr:hypothetical protein K438DRAFT_1763918 [Mycena galopus ATCC 62051]